MKCNQNIEKLIIIVLFESPSYSNKFKFKYLGKGPLPKRLIVFAFAGFAWPYGPARTKWRLKNAFPKRPLMSYTFAFSFMQKWSCLLKEVDRAQIIQLNEEILRWLKEFKPSS